MIKKQQNTLESFEPVALALKNELPQMKYPEQKGLISIIVPIYNTGNNLKECLDSILMQTFTNWEAILVDDGSTDSSGEIIDGYAEKDLRFIAIHKQNQGTLLARKTGLENSKGEFIANIDHDDAYVPQFLEKMYAKIMETNSDFVWCKYKVTNKENYHYFVTDTEWDIDRSENLASILLSFNIGHSTWNKLVRRKIYSKVYFPDVHLVSEDLIQIFQIAYHSKLVAFVPENLYLHKRGIGFSSNANLFISVKGIIFLKKTIENLFNGSMPYNVRKAFFSYMGVLLAICYFLLDKKARVQFKNEIEPILPEIIRAVKKLNLRMCLFLASKGIEFPLKLRESIKKRVKRID